MTYSDFTLSSVETRLGLTLSQGDLFPDHTPVDMPGWLPGRIQQGRQLALNTEKARGEFLVAPVLLAACDVSNDELSIFSGERLDVDPQAGLTGVCDFILALTDPLPRLKRPLVIVCQAVSHDIEFTLGQCVAQMVAAQRFNQQTDGLHGPMFGCVTSGEIWQFLTLCGNEVRIDRRRYYIDSLGKLLAVFQVVVETSMAGV